MSNQSGWNDPDMYYDQDRPQGYPPVQSGPYAAGSQQNPSGQGSYGRGSSPGIQAYGAGADPYGGGSYGAYGPASYGVQGAPMGYQALPPTNTLSIIALVASIFGVVSGVFLAGIGGIIMGHIARKQIRSTGERGDGLAVASLWVGYIGTGLWIGFWILYLLFIIFAIGGTLFMESSF